MSQLSVSSRVGRGAQEIQLPGITNVVLDSSQESRASYRAFRRSERCTEPADIP